MRRHYYSAAEIEDNIGSAMRRHFYYYNIMDGNLFEAFDSFGGVAGMDILIIGSNIPWYESNCVICGAKTTTVEYLPRFYDHPLMNNVMVGQQLDDMLGNGKLYDTILCISSIEHDGLGRYGDPINPNADLQTMMRMKRMLVQEVYSTSRSRSAETVLSGPPAACTAGCAYLCCSAVGLCWGCEALQRGCELVYP
jgi:hypothetical protein